MNRPGVSPLAQGSSRRERSGGRGEVGIEASTRFITWNVIEPIRCLTIFTIVPHATEHPIIVLDERASICRPRCPQERTSGMRSRIASRDLVHQPHTLAIPLTSRGNR